MRRSVRYLLVPALTFAIFLSLGLLSQDLLQQVGIEAIARSREVLLYLIQIGIWLSGAACLVRLINVIVWDRIVANALQQPVPRLLRDCVAVIIFGIALMGILGVVFGKDVTAIWATSGAVGVVLGFALRSVILDVFTGLMINLDRSYCIGDWVEVHHRDVRAPIYGRIREINWRTTHIDLENKNVVILPNSSLGTMAVTNYSRPEDLSRFEVLLTLDPTVRPERALRVLQAGVLAAVGKDGPVESPAPRVVLGEVTGDGIVYKVRYFLRINQVSPGTGRHTVLRHLLEHLRLMGLVPAAPRRDLFVQRGVERNVELDGRQTLHALLVKVDWFRSSLPDEDLQEIAAGAVRHSFKAQEIIIGQGDEGASMFVVAEGLLYVNVEDHQLKKQVRVGQLVPGQVFGEMSLLTGEPRSATVIAATDAVVFEIIKETMEAILKRRPEAAEVLSQVMAERRLTSSKALDGAARKKPEEHQTLASAILGRMKRFFSAVFQG